MIPFMCPEDTKEITESTPKNNIQAKNIEVIPSKNERLCVSDIPAPANNNDHTQSGMLTYENMLELNDIKAMNSGANE